MVRRMLKWLLNKFVYSKPLPILHEPIPIEPKPPSESPENRTTSFICQLALTEFGKMGPCTDQLIDLYRRSDAYEKLRTFANKVANYHGMGHPLSDAANTVLHETSVPPSSPLNIRKIIIDNANDILNKKTNGQITCHLDGPRQHGSPNDNIERFYFKLERYPLFWVQRRTTQQYPVQFVVYEIAGTLHASNEVELLSVLKTIFQAPSTLKIIQQIIERLDFYLQK